MDNSLDSNNLDYSDKILNCFGDSTTWGDNGMDTGGEDISWVHHIQKLVKFKDVRNYGVCASRIAVTEDRTDSFIERVNDMRTDADYVVVMGGINDFQHNVPLGDPRSKDIWTFYGALNILAHELLDQYPMAKIIFITPMKNNFHHPTKKYPTTLDKNKQGLYQIDYVNAIKSVCDYYAMPVIDMYAESGISPFVSKQRHLYMLDGLHYSDEGYARLAERIYKGLMRFI